MTPAPTHGFPVGVPGYQPLGLLGQGASGQVFKARQHSTGQFVAIKITDPGLLHDPASNRRVQQRLHQETRLLAMLQHAHVVRLIDKGMAAGGQLFAVLEFIPGETLREFLQRNGALSLPDTMALMAQLLDALTFLHQHQVVHRDLKPENLMVVSTGTALHLKLLDFGLASHHGEPRFMTGAEGTPAYCAPEQLRAEDCTPATDIYAWALIFLECLTARPCVQGANLGEILHRQLSASAIAIPDALANHPIAPLLRQALQKNLRQRTADAAGLYLDLLQCLAQLRTAVPSQAFLHTPAAPPETARQLTLDSMDIPEEPPVKENALGILCVGLRVYPARNSSLALPYLQEIREQQMRWCANTVQGSQGQSAGVLGDCMLFHFEQGTSSAQNLQQAAATAMDLCTRVQRRSRLLEVQHGVRLEISGGIHSVATVSLGDASSRNQGANVALHLNSMARPGAIVASQHARHALADNMQFEEYAGAASFQYDEHDRIFKLITRHGA
ncbi:Serine/threonine protein kinase [Polaromonas sp. YR568]|uniref:protein kinase domain-containing protein n=1 Tax=Polaromonas sp. YR568 TaxID=1855301 RepID=UPI0008F25D25|nr:protein kinase [Polaromonas sp. YR568]SFU88435.1 Serine/threonine protein kinase [Polaromonas sp. YR568]